ncbi:hypothetical protein AAF134_06430 [Synechococcus lacustris Tous-12m]
MPVASVALELAAAMPATDVEVEEAVSLVTADVVPSIPVLIVEVSTATALMESGMKVKSQFLLMIAFFSALV